MLSWFRKKSGLDASSVAVAAPSASELVRGKVAFARGAKRWTEEFDVVDIAAQLLEQHGRFATRAENSLSLDTSGYVLRPAMLSFKPLDDGGAQTTTIMRISHPRLKPAGLFEFQHSTGSTLCDSIAKGFEQWEQLDLTTLLDATEDKPQRCTAMEMTLPENADRPEFHRRILLGPIAHLRQNTPDENTVAEDHPFCPCCLLTKSMNALMPVIETDDFFGMRLFAMRGEDGAASADCRINGEEFEPAKQVLCDYVATWPPNGVEFRKQYIVVQSVPKPMNV